MTDKFIVSRRDALPVLDRIVRRKVRDGEVNTLSPGMNGNFNMGWDARPDSDWGKYQGHSFRIIVTDAALHEEAWTLLQAALTLTWPNASEDTQRSDSEATPTLKGEI